MKQQEKKLFKDWHSGGEEWDRGLFRFLDCRYILDFAFEKIKTSIRAYK